MYTRIVSKHAFVDVSAQLGPSSGCPVCLYTVHMTSWRRPYLGQNVDKCVVTNYCDRHCSISLNWRWEASHGCWCNPVINDQRARWQSAESTLGSRRSNRTRCLYKTGNNWRPYGMQVCLAFTDHVFSSSSSNSTSCTATLRHALLLYVMHCYSTSCTATLRHALLL